MALAQTNSPLLRRASNEVSWPFNLDWSHPEARGLEEFLVATPVGMVDLVSGAVGARVNTADPGRINELGGLDAFFDGYGDQYTFPNNDPFDTSVDYTIVWECELTGFVDIGPCLSVFFSAGGAAARLAYNKTTGSDILMADGTVLLARIAKPPEVSMTERHWGVWAFTAGSGHRVWINGLLCADNGTVTPAATANSHRVGGSSVTSHDFNGGIRQVRRYRRAWSEDEAIAFWHPATRDGLLSGFSHSPSLVGGYAYPAATGGSVASGSASLTTSYALTAVGVSLAGGTASVTASVSLSAAGASISSGSAGATALVSISAAGLAEAAGQAGLSNTVLLAAAGAAQASGNAALATRLEALADGAAESSGSASLLATLTFSASGGAIASGSADLQSVIAISADGFVEAMGSGTLWLRVDLAAAGAAQASGSAGMGLLLGSVLIPDARYVARLARRSYRVALPTP
jgi:hypothetical protein